VNYTTCAPWNWEIEITREWPRNKEMVWEQGNGLGKRKEMAWNEISSIQSTTYLRVKHMTKL